MSRFSSFAAFTRLLLFAVALVVAVLFVLLEGCRQFVMSTGCYTEVFDRNLDIAGFSFEISETDCWHSPAVSVFISRPGGGKRTRLFQYTRYIPTYNPNADPLPVITEIDEHTIQISLVRGGSLHCRRERWGRLKIKYDIGPVEYPNRDGRVPECSR